MKVKIPINILRSFFDTHFVVKETTDKNEIRINSIYSTDNKFHLYVNLDKGVFSCFKTSEYGSVYKLISDFLEIRENEVFSTLIKEYSTADSIKTFSVVEEIKKETKLELPKGLHLFSEGGEGIIRSRALNYLRKRKISDKMINELGYIYDDASEFNGRIFIPFYEEGQIVYFLARDFMGSDLRYKNPVGLDSKNFVYNIDNIKDEIVICEGIFDAISLDEQVAIPMLSAHIGVKQIEKIFDRVPSSIIIVPDNDETGQRTLQRNIQYLYEYKPASIKFRLGIYNLPEGIKDLNDLKQKTGKNYIDFSECEERKRQVFSMPVFGRKMLES